MPLNNFEDYEVYQERKQRLADMLGKSSEVIRELNMDAFGDNLKKLSEKVETDTFKIQVLGTFKNGKSTFINSLLGQYVLPAYAVPTTAVINEVKYGEEKHAVLYFCNPLPEKLPNNIPEKVLQHMKAFNMTDIPPLEIPFEEIEDYVVIPMDCDDPSQMLLETPYEKVELFWPLNLLENGVEIVDSPGLNEHASRTKVTMDYLNKADAIIFLLNAQQLCSQGEMNFIEHNLISMGFTDPFFVINRFDCIPPRERERLMQYAHMKLDKYTTNDLYFISSYEALESKESNDVVQYEKSGVKALEERLSKFLTEQKGKVKLAQPSRELKRILNEEALYKVIPIQRNMLASSLDDIKHRYEEAQPQLEKLRAEKEQLMSKMILRIEQSKHEFRRVANRFFLNMAEMVPAWIDAYEPSQRFGLLDQLSREKAQNLVTEISGYVSSCIDGEQAKWQNEVLKPLIEERSAAIFDAMATDFTKLLNDIDRIHVEISGTGDYQPSNVPVWQRIAGIAGGLMLGDVGLAASALINGISKELAITAAFEIGAGALLGVLGLLNPFTLGAVLVGAVIINWKRGSNNAKQKIKTLVSDEMVKQISEQADTNTNALVNNITSKLESLANQISSAIDTEISEAQKQVQNIIAEMEQGQANIEKRERVIADCESNIQQLSINLDAFILELIS